RDIMRDNHLVKVSSLATHFMGIDMSIEHNIGYVKDLYGAKGIYGVWDLLADVSAAIVSAQDCKKKVRKMMDTSYQKRGHSDVNTSALVWDVARAIDNEKLLDYDTTQKTNTTWKHTVVPNLQADGYQKLRATIGSFNKRMKAQ
ncbi:hypothetical protein BDP27DRAFT_1241329, partial [Rhodocollybia butyracea]